MNVTSRCVVLSGAKNFRDFGGYSTAGGGLVKSGLLYRADSLSGLSHEDFPILTELDIRTVCDLRRSEEKQRSPSRWVHHSTTHFIHTPLFLAQDGSGGIRQQAVALNNANTSRQIMLDLYRKMVTDKHALDQMQRIFQLLTVIEGLPVLIHCSGGKDRTGVVCALILALLEVPQEQIVDDYMLSYELFTRTVDLNRQSDAQVYDSTTTEPLSPEVLLPIYAVDPDYLHSSFSAITELYGSLEGFYTSALNLTEKEICAIRSMLVV